MGGLEALDGKRKFLLYGGDDDNDDDNNNNNNFCRYIQQCWSHLFLDVTWWK